MIVYAVFKEGVYRHECGGIFSTEELARAAAEILKAEESDDYHSFEVTPFDLDVVYGLTGGISEPARSYHTKGNSYLKAGSHSYADEEPLRAEMARRLGARHGRAGQDRQLSAPGFDPWDDVVLEGRHAPGMCTVLTYGPPGGATFQVECVFAWTRENWEQLQAWVDVAWNRGKPRPDPVSAEHPALQLWAVRRVLVTSVTVPVTVEAPLGLEHVDCEWKMVKLTLVEAA